MTTDTSFATRYREEDWLPVLELAVEEVFEIMVGCRVKPVPPAEPSAKGGIYRHGGFGRRAVRNSDGLLRRADRPRDRHAHARAKPPTRKSRFQTRSAKSAT